MWVLTSVLFIRQGIGRTGGGRGFRPRELYPFSAVQGTKVHVVHFLSRSLKGAGYLKRLALFIYS